MTSVWKSSGAGCKSWKWKLGGRLPSRILSQSESLKLPALVRIEEIAVAGADMIGGGHAGAAAQDHLAAHELAVVFAERARGWAETRIGLIGRGGVLPRSEERRVGKEWRCGWSAYH